MIIKHIRLFLKLSTLLFLVFLIRSHNPYHLSFHLPVQRQSVTGTPFTPQMAPIPTRTLSRKELAPVLIPCILLKRVRVNAFDSVFLW